MTENMNPKYVIGIFAALAIGFGAGHWWKESPPPHASEPMACEGDSTATCDEKLNALKSKFESISEKDIDEYIKLKDMKAKYEKADEIFGKILSIFLLDLGMRVSGQKLEDLKQASAQPLTPPPPPASEKDEELEAPRPAAKSSAPNPQARSRQQANTNRISNEEDAKKFAEGVAFPDPISAWDEASDLNRRQARMINGVFTGQVNYDDTKRQSMDVDIDLNARVESSGELVGQLNMKLVARDGSSNYNTNTGAGSTIKYFKTSSDGAILIDVGGGNGMMQLYFMRQMNGFYGNFYEKKGIGKLQKAGTIRLNKRS